MRRIVLFASLLVILSLAADLAAEPKLRIRLPERFRVLADQRFDLRVEAWDLTGEASVRLLIDGRDASVSSPEITRDNDEDAASDDQAWTFRGVSLLTPGVSTVEAIVSDAAGSARAETRIGVQELDFEGRGRSVILYIGDALGTAYRDAARIVARSMGGGFREGFFDEPLEMDAMPVAGMVMAHAQDRVVPDSANTASAWSTGNKTVAAGLGVLPDTNDWRFVPSSAQQTKDFALDNPRLETLWQYLKRRFGYRTGIVTTSDLTDATPAAAGAHTIRRTLGYDIARQFVDGSFTPGPVFDVLLGGGKQRFADRTPANSGDARDLAAELRQAGFAYVETRQQLSALDPAAGAPERLLGLFKTGDMNVAYDKLGLARPAGEPEPNFAGFTDQPFLNEMTQAALAVLSRDDRPFILLVEGASVDKQSHSNHAAGTIWDTIELDHAVGAGRRFAAERRGTAAEPLILVTGDHDQSMHILGIMDTAVEGAAENVRSDMPFPPAGGWPGAVDGFPDYREHESSGYPDNTNRYRIGVGFRTQGHTASSLPITAEGPGALLFTGYYDQTDIFFRIARAISADTSALDDLLIEKQRLEPVNPNY